MGRWKWLTFKTLIFEKFWGPWVVGSRLKFKSHVLQHRKKGLWLGTAGIGRFFRFFDFLCALNVPFHIVRNEFAYSWLSNKPTFMFIILKKKSLDLCRRISICSYFAFNNSSYIYFTNEIIKIVGPLLIETKKWIKIISSFLFERVESIPK